MATVDYKLWQNGLLSALGITKCDRVDYKVRQGLQSVAGLQSELVQLIDIWKILILYLSHNTKKSAINVFENWVTG